MEYITFCIAQWSKKCEVFNETLRVFFSPGGTGFCFGFIHPDDGLVNYSESYSLYLRKKYMLCLTENLAFFLRLNVFISTLNKTLILPYLCFA